MKLRYYFALIMAKLSIIALKIAKRNGTNFPGSVALKICPDFIKLAKKPKQVISVTGTNGKTTVSNMLVDIFNMEGKKVLHNRAGSNIHTGIATSLVNGMSIFGKSKYEMAVLEVDERAAMRIYPYINPEYILITNLSRDSIMRNAHPEFIRDILTDSIPKSSKLVLNADDLISSETSPENDRVYFGIEKMPSDIKKSINLINDIQICPKCNSKLEFEYLRYHHIGKAYCPNCGFKAPSYTYAGRNLDLENMVIEVSDLEGVGKYKLVNESVFNIYNVVSAVALLRRMGYSHEKIEQLQNKINIARSRYDEEKVDSSKVIKLMAKDKNAYATSRVFDYISTTKGDKEVILMNSCQDDMVHWSENTCWLYDCDFEFLNDENIKNFVVVGPRRFDHKLRALLAGVSEDRISLSETEIGAVDKLKLFSNDNIYVLYGSDSIDLGNRVADKIKEKISSKNNGGM